MGTGLGILRISGRKTGDTYETDKVSDSDPNPALFRVVRHCQEKSHLVLMVNYPNCTNYEGNKILLILNASIEHVRDLKEIDPHFTHEDKIKPFARFEPTMKGWEAAVCLAKCLSL